MASIADEVAALRGTRSATLKDLLTNPGFSRLLAAMTVSSLGDWVGFVAVTSLVASLSGITHGGVRRRGRDDRQDASRDPLRAVRRRVRRPVRPQEDHDRGRRRARCAVRHDGVRPSPRDHLPAVLRDRMLLAAVDTRPRRVATQPGPEATARERELDRAREHVRDAPARRGGVRRARGDQQRDRSQPAADPRAPVGCGHVRVLGGDGERRAPEGSRRLEGSSDSISRVSGATSWTGCASSARTRSRRR